MKRIIIILVALVAVLSINAQEKKDVMTKEKGTYTILTETLCSTKGYKQKGLVPLKVTVKKDKIVSVEALPNQETPKFFAKISTQMLPKYKGLKFSEHDKVDCVTGATITSKVVKENMKAAYEYYQANK